MMFLLHGCIASPQNFQRSLAAKLSTGPEKLRRFKNGMDVLSITMECMVGLIVRTPPGWEKGQRVCPSYCWTIQFVKTLSPWSRSNLMALERKICSCACVLNVVSVPRHTDQYEMWHGRTHDRSTLFHPHWWWVRGRSAKFKVSPTKCFRGVLRNSRR